MEYFFAYCFFGLSQYGDLHFGHTRGTAAPRGAHSCPHALLSTAVMQAGALAQILAGTSRRQLVRKIA